MTGKTAIVSLALTALLMTSALLALAFTPQSGQAQDGSSDQERIDRLWKAGESQDLFGPLNYSSGVAHGKFVDFNYSERTGTLSDLRVATLNGTVTVLDKLTMSNLRSGEVNVTGPLFQVDGNEARLLVHNNPTALVQIAAAQGNEVVLDLPEGTNVTTANSTQGPTYNITVDGAQVWMLAVGANVTVDGRQVTISFNETGAMLLRTLPEIEGIPKAIEEALMVAIGNAFIGNEAWVLARSDGNVDEVAEINGVAANITEASVGSVSMEIGGDIRGRAISIINVDKETIDPSGKVTVMVNGENVSEMNFTALMKAVVKGDKTPSYTMVEARNTTKFLVYLPDLIDSSTVVIKSS